jgi:hypothetical protein
MVRSTIARRFQTTNVRMKVSRGGIKIETVERYTVQLDGDSMRINRGWIGQCIHRNDQQQRA